MGELEVRGPWVASSYYDTPEQADRWTADGWFRTGDIVSINPRGYIQIKDRSKDVIKSGGEWISSVELENALMAHPVGRRGGGDRRPRREVGRAAARGDRAEAGRRGVGRRTARLPRAELREVVAARAVRVRGRDPEDERGQVQEDGVARPVRAASRPILESRAPARGRRAVRARRRARPRGEREGGRPRARGGHQLRRRARSPRPLSADAGAAGDSRLRDRGRARGRNARDGDHVGRRRLCGEGRRRSRAGRAAARPRVVRGGRGVPADVSDRAHSADAAGARPARLDRARLRGRRRRRVGRDPGRADARRARDRRRRLCRRSSTSAARSAPKRRTSTTSCRRTSAPTSSSTRSAASSSRRRSRGCARSAP